ncbi:MAG: hypothetical protein RR350_03055 [Oscillibacter sp.]
MKTIIVAALAMTGGTILGFLFCQAAVRRLRLRLRAARSGTDDPKKMGVMDKVLILEGVILVAYTVADLVVFWHTGAEPTTLTACVFGVCGIENGIMGWIKTNKDKAADPNGSAAGAAPPLQRQEPTDVGQ